MKKFLIALAAIVAACGLWYTNDTSTDFERAIDASRAEFAARYPDAHETAFYDCWRGSFEEEVWLTTRGMYDAAYPEKF